jgi:ribosome-binding protein aMBF1 (putative translation factor)
MSHTNGSTADHSVTQGGRVFGTLVANQRAKLGWSRKELAARIHASPSTVARIERGHPPGTRIRRKLTETLSSDHATTEGHRRMTGVRGLIRGGASIVGL